jgi:hypothetical protein
VTPTISSIAKSNGDTQLDLTVSGMSFDNSYIVKVHYGSMEAQVTDFSSAPSISAAFPNGFTPGQVDVRVSIEKGDILRYTASSQQTIALAATTGSSVNCSWAGG